MLLVLVAASAAVPAPHIVMHVLDDIGSSDLSFCGAEFATRSIDSIVSTGVRLQQYYVQVGTTLLTRGTTTRFNSTCCAGNLLADARCSDDSEFPLPTRATEGHPTVHPRWDSTRGPHPR
jgi:hypothetical protein